MRVAALYDIHGNLPALEAVLDEPDRLAADVILVGGDFVMGPMPQETLQRLRALGNLARFIHGNTEREILKAHDGSLPESAPWASRARWVAEQLSHDELSFISGLPETLTFDIAGVGPALFCHGSPRSDEDIITRATPEERLREMLQGVRARVVVCGHTHMQFDRIVDDIRVVNAGSVGMPYEEEHGAFWALFGPVVALKRTFYDAEEAMRRMVATRFPDIENFARDRMVNRPRPNDAIALFEKIADDRASGAKLGDPSAERRRRG